MKRFVAGFENNSAVCAASYFLPLLLAPYFIMRLPVFIGAVVVTALFGMAAGRESRLRFHAFQAAIFLIAARLTLVAAFWLFYGANKDRLALEDGLAALMTIGMMMVVLLLIALVFGVAYFYAAVKAAAGKDVLLPVAGPLAAWIAREMRSAAANLLAGVARTAKEIARGEYRLKDHRPELGAMTVIFVLIAVLAFTVPGIFTSPPEQAPPRGITATALTSTESFVGFPWDIDVEQTKKLVAERGWKTGDQVSAMTGLGCLAVLEGYPARLQLFYVSDQGFPRHLYKGFISMREKDIPVEVLYRRFHGMLTEKYGPVAERDYPPWRSPNTPPYGPGYGSRWEFTDENGQKFRIHLALEFDKPGNSSAPASPAALHLRFENLTVYEKAIQKRRQD